ncbi:MAG: alkaline phosphatase family protein [Candidatus Eremiobacter antarcticus]|nr:hypothetical protein [Candidatus Eremiobacteraeota bacterium]MBC5808863.1 hypothetical protein [Candidatus Eremiobacteraeota bacterium]
MMQTLSARFPRALFLFLVLLGSFAISLTGCGSKGALTPPVPEGGRPNAGVTRGRQCVGNCGTSAPSALASGVVTETGTVFALNIYGADTPMFVVHSGSPYEIIGVYGSATEPFLAGQEVVVTGTYQRSVTGNQWIDASTVTLANGSPVPSPVPSGNPTPLPTPTGAPTPTPIPTPTGFSAIEHVELVMMENTGYDKVVGNSSSMPYINNVLIPQGKLFTNSYALDHPSLPNYLALYAGSELGTSGTDTCPLSLSGATLGSELSAAGLTFIGYAEDMPGAGSTACTAADGAYQGHHSPWIYFPGQAGFGQPYDGFPGSMPDVAFIVPNDCHNMHDSCGGNNWRNGDTYLSQQLPPIIAWNATHNGLLIVTWDESSYSTLPPNHIATIMVGPMVARGSSSQQINHYDILRTITDAFGLTPLNGASGITP